MASRFPPGPLPSLAAAGLALVLSVGAATARAADDEAPPPPLDPEVAAQLVTLLDDADPASRQAAAQELREHPADALAAGAVPRLVARAADDPVTEVREEALWALAEIGPPAYDEAHAALIALCDPLAKHPGYVQGIAAYALGRMQPPAEVAARTLIPLLMSMDDFSRRAAADACAQVGEPLLPYLLLVLVTQEAPRLHGGVVEALGRMGPVAAPAIPALLELRDQTDRAWLARDISRTLALIGHDDADAHVARLIDDLEQGRGSAYLTIVALGDMGPVAHAAAPAILARAEHDDTRRVAIEALLAILPEAEWGPTLVFARQQLARADWEGHSVATTLAEAGEAGRRALVEALEDSAPGPRVQRKPGRKKRGAGRRGERTASGDEQAAVLAPPTGNDHGNEDATGEGADDDAHPTPVDATRRNALYGLAHGDAPPPEDSFKPLRAALDDADGEHRRAAADALARLGEPALQPLEAAIRRESDLAVRGSMIRALGKVGPAARDALVRHLRGDDLLHAGDAVVALAELGPLEPALVPDLLRASAAADRFGQASEVMRSLDPQTVPALIDGLGSDNASVRHQAALSLGHIGADAAPATVPLARALSDDEEDVRQWAAWALGRIGPGAIDGLGDLRAALADPEVWVRKTAAEAIGQLGQEAAVAVPDLIAAIEHDRGWGVPERAADALGALGPAAADAVDPLTAALARDDDAYLRAAAARAILAIGIAPPATLERLRVGLDDPKARVRAACAEALLALGTPADIGRASVVARRAPDEMWDEDMKAMQQIDAWLEPPPPIEEGEYEGE